MGLNLRQKADLYRELGQLLRSGRAFPAAVQMLQSDSPGAVRRLLERLRKSVDAGRTVGEAFAAEYPVVSKLETGIIGACSRTGKLDQGCAYLSDYFERLEAARWFVIKRSAYPLFVLHFGVFAVGLQNLFGPNGSSQSYLKHTVGFLLLLYGCAIIVALLAMILSNEGARNATVDRMLRLIPGVGKTRRAFALARFCATYEMQLQSGINVMDSLASAGAASQSGLVQHLVKRIIPEVRQGSQVGPLLSGSDAFTQKMIRAIRIGEDTGELDAELKRLADEFYGEAVSRLEMLAGFLAKFLYVMVMLYTAWQIVRIYTGYLKAVDSIFGNM